MSEIRLDLGDIQGTVLRPGPAAYRGAFLLFRIDDAAAARAALRDVLGSVTSAAHMDRPRPFTFNIAFTHTGLERLGVPQESFPREFRDGMAARKDVLGDVGDSDPARWESPLGTGDVHIGIVIIAGDEADLERPLALAADFKGVSQVYRRDVHLPPGGKEHFGFREGIGGPYVVGSGIDALPGQDHVMPGEFILGYEDGSGRVAPLPEPEILTRNGTFVAFRQCATHVAEFRRYLKEHARSPEDEELLAAKIVGRWRSGAPLALSPDHDDPGLGADPHRNNDFTYDGADPDGLRVPRGAHIRRVNPRDSLTGTIVDTRIHRMVRRGALYGPPLPEGRTDDDGVERGLIFIFMGASLTRQFEFIQQVWINNGDFTGLGTERDPLVGANDGTGVHTIPAHPLRRRLTGLPRFVTVRGGEYLFMPGLTALDWIATRTPAG
ncbi:Dyp-type peroxidase [Nonomuraea sp. NPDC050540]|uniref:Dyp-type peroxidase n=1 Tax=Nonomuraea sp. NPDC050540 TaxID=3364367 RepID=UPI0037AF3AAC